MSKLNSQQLIWHTKPLVVLAVSLCCLIVGGPASAKLPAFCRGDHVPEKYTRKVVLTSKSDNVALGGYVYTRLFNGLKRPVGLGERYLQSYIGGKWERVPPSVRPEGSEPIHPPPIRRVLPAGSAGECRSFRVDPERPPGRRYRVVNEVYLNLRPGATPRIRTTEFYIR
jgi:hypothetical protein